MYEIFSNLPKKVNSLNLQVTQKGIKNGSTLNKTKKN